MDRKDAPSTAYDLHRPEVDTSAVDPHKLKRKINLGLLPWPTLLYIMNFLDKGSIGKTRVGTHAQHAH